MNGILDYILNIYTFIISILGIIIGYQQKRISDLDRKFEKYVHKDVFDEFKSGLFKRLDDMEKNIKEDIKDLKDKIK